MLVVRVGRTGYIFSTKASAGARELDFTRDITAKKGTRSTKEKARNPFQHAQNRRLLRFHHFTHLQLVLLIGEPLRHQASQEIRSEDSAIGHCGLTWTQPSHSRGPHLCLLRQQNLGEKTQRRHLLMVTMIVASAGLRDLSTSRFPSTAFLSAASTESR